MKWTKTVTKSGKYWIKCDYIDKTISEIKEIDGVLYLSMSLSLDKIFFLPLDIFIGKENMMFAGPIPEPEEGS